MAPIYDEITGDARVSEFTNFGIVSKIQYVAPPTSDPNISVVEPTGTLLYYMDRVPDSIEVGFDLTIDSSELSIEGITGGLNTVTFTP